MSDALTESGQPTDDTPIWRYMDLSRFVALLASRMMWFPKLEELWLNDPWEGFAIAKGLRRLSKGRRVIPADEISRVLVAEVSAYAAKTVRNSPKHVYVNSWCLGPESLGMWERYGAGARGVAIESTVGLFKKALQQNLRREQYAFDRVHYHPDLACADGVRHDFRRGTVPMSGNLWKRPLRVAFNKRTFYLDESEWRAAIFQEQLRPDDVGLTIPINLRVLLKSVRLGPRADSVTGSAVRAVMDWSKVSTPIQKSGILKPPKTRRSR